MSTSIASIRKAPIPTFNSLEVVYISDISYLEAYENYCKVHFLTGECIVSTYSLGTIMTLLENEPFFRCHKSYSINLEHVLRFHRSLDIEFINGRKVPVARRRKEEFLSELHKWITVGS